MGLQLIVLCRLTRWLSDTSNLSNFNITSRACNYDEFIINKEQCEEGGSFQARAGALQSAETRNWQLNPLYVGNRFSAEERQPSSRYNNYFYTKEVVLVCLGMNFPQRIFKPHLSRMFAQICEDHLEVVFSASDVYVEFFAPRRRQSRSIVVLRVSHCLARVLLSNKYRLPVGITLDSKRSTAELNRLWSSRKQNAQRAGEISTVQVAPIHKTTIVPPSPPPPSNRGSKVVITEVAGADEDPPGNQSHDDGWLKEAERAVSVYQEYIDAQGQMFLLIEFDGFQGKGDYWGYYAAIPEEVSLDLKEVFYKRKQAECLSPLQHQDWIDWRKNKKKKNKKKKEKQKKLAIPPPIEKSLDLENRVAGSFNDGGNSTDRLIRQEEGPAEGVDQDGGIAARVGRRRRMQRQSHE